MQMIDFDINKSTCDSHVLDHKRGFQFSESTRGEDLTGKSLPLANSIRASQTVRTLLPGAAALRF